MKSLSIILFVLSTLLVVLLCINTPDFDFAVFLALAFVLTTCYIVSILLFPWKLRTRYYIWKGLKEYRKIIKAKSKTQNPVIIKYLEKLEDDIIDSITLLKSSL